MGDIDEELRQRGFQSNGPTSFDDLYHYYKELKTGYIYVWTKPGHYAFGHSTSGMAVGAQHTFKKMPRFLQRLDETLAKVK